MTRTGPQGGVIAGTITARGVTRPADLEVRFSRPIDMSVHISATTRIDRREFGVAAWSLIVGRQVTIAIETELQPSA